MPLAPMISAKCLGGMPGFVEEVAGERRAYRALDAAGLPQSFAFERDGYIPERCLSLFVHEAARASGQQNIGLLWAPYLTAADYGRWGEFVLNGSTLREGLLRCSMAMPYHSSTDRAWLEVGRTQARYCYAFGLKGEQSYPDIGFSAVAVFLSIFRAYLGGQWVPNSILLDFPKTPSSHEAEDVFGCPVIWDTPRLGVQFPKALLSTPHPGSERIAALETTMADIGRERAGGPPKDLAGRVSSLIFLQPDYREISLEKLAQKLDVGVRTLQRQLEREGTTYRDLLNRVRIERATELLQSTTFSVSDIAVDLGYNSPGNFTRAFKKATGFSPSQVKRKPI